MRNVLRKNWDFAQKRHLLIWKDAVEYVEKTTVKGVLPREEHFPILHFFPLKGQLFDFLPDLIYSCWAESNTRLPAIL